MNPGIFWPHLFTGSCSAGSLQKEKSMSFRFRLVAGLLACTCAVSGAVRAGESAAAAAPQPLWKGVVLPAAAAGLTLRGLCFVDDKLGWIVGDKGLCLATSDGGQTWSVVATGSDATLRAVRFLDEKRGFACGDGDSAAPKSTGHVVMGRPYQAGLLLSTEDGGKTWKKNWVPCNFEIWCVEPSTAPVVQVGVGAEAHLDGDITRSSDGGATWQERRVFRALSDIRAVDAKRWVAVGSPVSVGFTGGIQDPAYLAKDCRALFSDDAGQTWKVAKGSDGAAVLRGLLVRKGLPVFAVGDGGALLASGDRGESWAAVAHPAGADLHLRAVAANADNKALVAVGARGRFLLSADSGKTWRASWTGTSEHLLAVAACGERFWSVGANGFAASCEAKTLLEARELVAAPPPPAEPVRQATAEQRARVRVGDYLIVAQRMKCPEMGMDFEVQVKLTVTALEADGFTLVQEIVKGTPPPGTPPKTESRVPLAELEEFSGYEVGRSRKIPAGSAKVSRMREPDQTLTVAGKKLECLVLKTEGEIPGVGRIASRFWYCPAEIPILSVVKSEEEQTTILPNGATAKLTRSQELLEWGRKK